MDIGPTELFIILIIVILIFGPGRLVHLGSELGQGIREFRQGLQGDQKKEGEIEDDRVDNTSVDDGNQGSTEI